MYSKLNIADFCERTKRKPKLYLGQRLTVGDNDTISYYLYTIVEEGQLVAKEDILDLVVIPDTRPVIIGDFNATDASMTIMEVTKAIKEDAGFASKDKFESSKTPIWSYKDNAELLANYNV